MRGKGKTTLHLFAREAKASWCKAGKTTRVRQDRCHERAARPAMLRPGARILGGVARNRVLLWRVLPGLDSRFFRRSLYRASSRSSYRMQSPGCGFEEALSQNKSGLMASAIA